LQPAVDGARLLFLTREYQGDWSDATDPRPPITPGLLLRLTSLLPIIFSRAGPSQAAVYSWWPSINAWRQ
jgi:hypothetical protein